MPNRIISLSTLLQPVNQQIGVFIDEANIDCTAKQLGFQIDYAKLAETLVARGTNNALWRATLYAPEATPYHNDRTKFFDAVGLSGVRLVTKPPTYSGRELICDLDVDIATDLIWYGLQRNFGVAYLCSGDADFIPPVRLLRRSGCKIIIVSSLHEKACSASRALLDSADDFIDLADIASRIACPQSDREEILPA